MSNELFINFMREKGLEPNQIDLKNFDFMARSLMQDEIERLEDNYTALSKANQWFIKRIAELEKEASKHIEICERHVSTRKYLEAKITELEKERGELIKEFAEAECMGDLAKITRQYGYEAL
jgi:septal ring factor EnvC (AmiA/AmiB activator)